ncbi:4-carboxymuconolactone decarboxylase [Streptacidiphilus sp. MAP12-20]|uniref:carboxymuconolactone decarboxylase family protein n=1 Tax=Streptacidiphilus sp. MAP12-20 TaxID=3156299 RepID=UPI003511E8A7
MSTADTPKTPAQQLLGDTTPKLVELTDQVLFGDVWERPELSPRDRSLITISALVTGYRLEQLPAHLRIGLANGLTREELAEAITHLAFYTGWPNAMSAGTALRAIVEETPEPKGAQQEDAEQERAAEEQR